MELRENKINALFALRNAIRKGDVKKIDDALFAFIEHGYCFDADEVYKQKYQRLKKQAIGILNLVEPASLSVSTQSLILQSKPKVKPVVQDVIPEAVVIADPVPVATEPIVTEPKASKHGRKLRRTAFHFKAVEEEETPRHTAKDIDIKHKRILDFVGI